MPTKTNMLVVVVAALTLCQGVLGQAPSLQDLLADAFNQTHGQDAQIAAQSAAQQLQSIVHTLVASGETVFNGSHGIIQGLIDEVHEVIQTALGNLPQCITSEQDDAAKLFSNATEGVWKCVVDEVSEVGQLIRDVAALASQAVLLPNQAAANITACMRHPLTAVFCVANAVTALGNAAQQIVAKVTADVMKGEQLLVSGPRDIAVCAAKQVQVAAQGAHNIIVTVSQCVVDGSNSTAPCSKSP